MRASPFRHPLAFLRHIAGLNQSELADLCGCSNRTIQAVELLKLPLSTKLAMKIADATGVNVAWLLDGDLENVPEVGDYPVRKHFLQGAVIPRGNRNLDEYGQALYQIVKSPADKRHLDSSVFTRSLFRTHRELLESSKVADLAADTSKPKASPRRRTKNEENALADLKKTDASIIDLCRNLLQDTRGSRDKYIVRWQVKKFLNNLISHIPQGKSLESESMKKKVPATRKHGRATLRRD